MSEDPSSVGDPGGAPAVRAPDPPRRRAIAWRVLVPLGVAAAITLGVVGWAAAAGNGNAAPAPSRSPSHLSRSRAPTGSRSGMW